VIIVASPDERHWGESEFSKERGIPGGTFRYFPLWSWDEIKCARSILVGTKLTEPQLFHRFRIFGGVPRNVFANEESVEYNLNQQDLTINNLKPSQGQAIALGTMDVETLTRTQPRSALIGYALPAEDDLTKNDFSNLEVQVISPRVAEKVYSKFISELWQEMLNSRGARGEIFEAYTRQLMIQNSMAFQCRDAFKTDDKRTGILLGGCTEIRLVEELNKLANMTENVVFHSVNPNQELIDFIYRQGEVVHAFQATCALTHSYNECRIQNLFDGICRKNMWSLKFYYLVPANNFKTFTLEGKQPTMLNVTFLCGMVPDPRQNQMAITRKRTRTNKQTNKEKQN
jgi:hypothetical protein